VQGLRVTETAVGDGELSGASHDLGEGVVVDELGLAGLTLAGGGPFPVPAEPGMAVRIQCGVQPPGTRSPSRRRSRFTRSSTLLDCQGENRCPPTRFTNTWEVSKSATARSAPASHSCHPYSP